MRQPFVDLVGTAAIAAAAQVGLSPELRWSWPAGRAASTKRDDSFVAPRGG